MTNFITNLRMFDPDPKTNTTTQSSLSYEMKEFYEKQLIRLAGPLLVHDQFGQKKNIPQNGGKTIEFRKYDSLPKLTTPLSEGVTPDGQSLTVTHVEATVSQYGGYVTLSDMLLMTAIDNNQTEALELIADQAGRTIDTLTREILVAGTNVIRTGGVAARNLVNTKLTVKDIKNAVRVLKLQNAKKINGNYACIIHPNCYADLEDDDDWKDPHKYVDTTNIYTGEIGEMWGVKFYESTEAKVFEGEGASSADVYATLVIGQNAYGVTEIEGGGLQYIAKQLGAGEDPLNQRSSVGWKCSHTAERLVEQYMVRIESTSSYTA